jgi:sterol desaturase/sphingolipid hydroxylase (fatty acid hydroxylase superfamily)
MKPFHGTRQKIRDEIESPPAERSFGSGWASGVLGIVLSLGGLLLVISMCTPGHLLTAPQLTPLKVGPWFKLGAYLLLVAGFMSSATSLALRQAKILGTTGIALALLATAIGQSITNANASTPLPIYFGLDWFALNVLLTGIIFVPIERIFPRQPTQPIFRDEWREDVFYVLVSSLMIQALAFLPLTPGKLIGTLTPLEATRRWVADLPLFIQVPAIMLGADFFQYWGHRAFHHFPWLWRFHAVHHSAQRMDWMSGARMHFLEILLMRSITAIPMFALGFTPLAIEIYVMLAYLYTTLIHANVGWRLPWVDQLLVTPQFHHWHHGAEKEAIDVNFAIHFPIFDRLFGTHYLPGKKWPESYGIEGHPVPKGYWAQLIYPFRRK